jgi:hypothetical protein
LGHCQEIPLGFGGWGGNLRNPALILNKKENSMIRKSKYCCLLAVGLGLLLALNTAVAAAPTAKMTKEVVDYYYTGQKEGPVLTEAKLCKGVQKFECTETINPDSVTKGQTINVWMQFFVPKEASYDDILVEYKHEGVPRRLTPHKIESSIRYRLVDKNSVDKTGNWTITVKKGITQLKEFKIKVVK